MKNIQSTIQYAFIGAGAATTLLMLQMELEGLLNGKQIIILDPDGKTQNDRTFCYWCSLESQVDLSVKSIIKHQWSNIKINQYNNHELGNLTYRHIQGIDLYNELRKLIEKYSIRRVYENVNDLKWQENNVQISTATEHFYANWVFDSRPPEYLPPKENESILLQSFIGYFIRTKSRIECDSVDLMDFNIPQNNKFEFMYTLPFDQNSALVELTSFNQEILSLEDAKKPLENYIYQKYGHFEITNIESGCIPMISAELNVPHIPNVVPIGSRNGCIKPSTGYAFKSMLEHSKFITSSLKNNSSPLHKNEKGRFKLYDRLLLKIIETTPQKGTNIFKQLFNRNQIPTILNFLDEKSTIIEDVRIFSTLPFAIFAKQLLKDFCIRHKKEIPTYILFVITLILAIAKHNLPILFTFSQIVFGILGLFLVGIPHGALDYWVEQKFTENTKTLIFIISYLIKSLGFLLFWLLSPSLAIYFFILFSIWHFGNTDIMHWQLKKFKSAKSWAWGSLVLFFLLLGHLVETNEMLKALNVAQLPFNPNSGLIMSIILGGIGIVWAMIEKNTNMVVITLILLISIKLPLITAFGIYFIGNHSMNGWIHLKQGLSQTNKTLTIKALPFTMGAFLILIILVNLLETKFHNHQIGFLYPTFFIFLGCISFPHVLAMNQFYKKTNLQ